MDGDYHRGAQLYEIESLMPGALAVVVNFTQLQAGKYHSAEEILKIALRMLGDRNPTCNKHLAIYR